MTNNQITEIIQDKLATKGENMKIVFIVVYMEK